MKTYRVTKIRNLNTFCPEQFEGYFDDGSNLYVRFRSGYLRVDKDFVPIYGEQIGDLGIMRYADLRRLTEFLIEWPEECDGRYD